MFIAEIYKFYIGSGRSRVTYYAGGPPVVPRASIRSQKEMPLFFAINTIPAAAGKLTVANDIGRQSGWLNSTRYQGISEPHWIILTYFIPTARQILSQNYF